jgi:hypothetical protein
MQTNSTLVSMDDNDDSGELPDYSQWTVPSRDKPTTKEIAGHSDEDEDDVPDYSHWEFKSNEKNSVDQQTNLNNLATSVIAQTATKSSDFNIPQAEQVFKRTVAVASPKPVFEQLIQKKENKSQTLLGHSLADQVSAMLAKIEVHQAEEQEDESDEEEESLSYDEWRKRHFEVSTKQANRKVNLLDDQMLSPVLEQQKQPSENVILRQHRRPQVTQAEHMRMLQWMFPLLTPSKEGVK